MKLNIDEEVFTSLPPKVQMEIILDIKRMTKVELKEKLKNLQSTKRRSKVLVFSCDVVFSVFSVFSDTNFTVCFDLTGSNCIF